MLVSPALKSFTIGTQGTIHFRILQPCRCFETVLSSYWFSSVCFKGAFFFLFETCALVFSQAGLELHYVAQPKLQLVLLLLCDFCLFVEIGSLVGQADLKLIMWPEI